MSSFLSCATFSAYWKPRNERRFYFVKTPSCANWIGILPTCSEGDLTFLTYEEYAPLIFPCIYIFDRLCKYIETLKRHKLNTFLQNSFWEINTSVKIHVTFPMEALRHIDIETTSNLYTVSLKLWRQHYFAKKKSTILELTFQVLFFDSMAPSLPNHVIFSHRDANFLN